MAVVEIQSVSGTEQFDGSENKGLWNFNDRFRHLPRATAIQIDALSYNEDLAEMGPIITAIGFIAFRVGQPVVERFVWARDNSNTAMGGGLINPVTGNAGRTYPGFRLPREPGDNGEWWNIFLLTKDKKENAAASLTYYLIAHTLDT